MAPLIQGTKSFFKQYKLWIREVSCDKLMLWTADCSQQRTTESLKEIRRLILSQVNANS